MDPEARTLEILTLGTDGRYVLAASESSTVVNPPECDGLKIDLPSLWERVDALPPGED